MILIFLLKYTLRQRSGDVVRSVGRYYSCTHLKVISPNTRCANVWAIWNVTSATAICALIDGCLTKCTLRQGFGDVVCYVGPYHSCIRFGSSHQIHVAPMFRRRCVLHRPLPFLHSCQAISPNTRCAKVSAMLCASSVATTFAVI